MNCRGCKWLDRYKTDGNGYCCMVTRIKTYETDRIENGKWVLSSKVRRPGMERCELYETGDFETRHRKNVEKILKI